MTRVLGLCGAALPRHCLGPAADNETGFWEAQAIVDLHDEILASAGTRWQDFSEFPAAWYAGGEAAAFRQRLVAILRAEFADAPLFIVKDPRLCRLLPFWLSVLGEMDVAPLAVIPVRHPLEVAASLKGRDGFDAATSLLLWLRHFLAAERETRGLRRAFVAYDGLIDDWRGTVDRIGRDLGVVWPERLEAEIERFLAPRFRHHSFAAEEVQARPDVVRWVKAAYGWAMGAVQGHEAPAAELDIIHAAFADAEIAFQPLLTAGRMAVMALAGLNDEVAQLRLERDAYTILKEEYRRLADERALVDRRLAALETQQAKLLHTLHMDNAPAALRAVLPVARLLRAISRRLG